MFELLSLGACISIDDFSLTKSNFNVLSLGREQGGMRREEWEQL